MDLQTKKNACDTLDIIIPAYHSDDKFQQLIMMLFKQTRKPDRIIVLHTQDSPEDIQQLPENIEGNIEVIPIEKAAFDHGGTRKYGASLSHADILMFMTQDAIPADEHLIERLLEPYADEQVAATYARQLANDKDDILEKYTRTFNYPKKDRIKSKEDLRTLGIKTFFCSNVCATYRRNVYKELGGFVDKTIFNEDMILASGMIQAGYKIAYAAQAKVYHSHHYSYMQQFTRNFDLGVSHNQYSEVFYGVSSQSEGIKLVANCLKTLIDKKQFYLIPELIINSGFKFVGYQMGKRYDLFSKDFVKRCSMNKTYWK